MPTTSIAERVREIQRGAGLNNTAFAEAISTTPSKLSKSYSGDRKFTTTELAIAASVGSTSVDWILTGEHARTPRIAARTAQVVEGQQDDAIAIVDRFTRAARQIEMIDGSRELPALPELDKSPLFIVQAQKLARSALDMMQCAGRGLHGGDLAEALEETFGIDVAITALPDGVSGCSWQTAGIRFMAIDRSEVRVRQRFTMAHELGHLLAGDAQQIIEDDGSHATKESPIVERRADAFAANFLMPDCEISDRFSSGINESNFAEGLAHFGVSALALSWRLVNAGLLSISEQPSWGSRKTGAVLGQAGLIDHVVGNLPDAHGERIPERLASRHLELYLAGKSSARPLANLLNASPEQIIDTYGAGVEKVAE